MQIVLYAGGVQQNPIKIEMQRLLESEVDQKPNNRGQMPQKQFIQKKWR